MPSTPDGHASRVWIRESMRLPPHELHSSSILVVVPDVAFWSLRGMG